MNQILLLLGSKSNLWSVRGTRLAVWHRRILAGNDKIGARYFYSEIFDRLIARIFLHWRNREGLDQARGNSRRSIVEPLSTPRRGHGNFLAGENIMLIRHVLKERRDHHVGDRVTDFEPVPLAPVIALPGIELTLESLHYRATAEHVGDGAGSSTQKPADAFDDVAFLEVLEVAHHSRKRRPVRGLHAVLQHCRCRSRADV